eukprot:TRINITY_DN21126_c0_g1_i1.p2 TRINITY_DN21126_c0_g1~~TRINITY_DN21126_c0_g1_i1.p2  ORF type:complete len:119 (+),score=16.45 TRINITY_DN21126_c0_g1_i1:1024-1380(+)
MFRKRSNLEDLIKIGNNDKTYQPNMAVTANAAQMSHKGKVCVTRGSMLCGILFPWERGILHSLPSRMKSISSQLRKSAHFSPYQQGKSVAPNDGRVVCPRNQNNFPPYKGITYYTNAP